MNIFEKCCWVVTENYLLLFNEDLVPSWHSLDKFLASALGYGGPCFLNTCPKSIVVSVIVLANPVFNILAKIFDRDFRLASWGLQFFQPTNVFSTIWLHGLNRYRAWNLNLLVCNWRQMVSWYSWISLNMQYATPSVLADESTPRQENPSHTIWLPPLCFTVLQVELYSWHFGPWTNILPSNLMRLFLVSSLRSTVFQKCRLTWSAAKHSRASVYFSNYSA